MSNLPAASTYLHLSQSLLGGIAGAVLLLSVLLCIGIYRRRLPEQPYPDNLLVGLPGAVPCACQADA